MTQTQTDRPSGSPDGLGSAATAIVPTGLGLTPDQERALQIAHAMVDAGIPVFPATRNHSVPMTHRMPFHLPNAWQQWRPNHDAVNRWRPGMALAAVCGIGFDVLDTDLQNNGLVGRAELEALGLWPEVFGIARTASGGTHELILPTRLAKAVPAQGVDLQAGAPDGNSRGFVFIAPTVRLSKTTGELTEYRWEVEPDLAALKAAEPSATHRKLVTYLAMPKGKKPTPPAAVQAGPAAPADDLFTPAEDVWSPQQAQTAIDGQLQRVRDARQGEVNSALGGAARLIGKFVVAGHLAEETAAQALLEAVEAGGVHSDEWNAANGLDWTARSVIATAMARATEDDPITVAGNPHRYDTEAYYRYEAERDKKAARARRTPLRDRLLNLKQLRELPPAKPLIKGVLDLDSATWLIGPPGGFKSFVALDWACHVATGKAWDGHKTAEGDVIYVVAEGAKSFTKRVDAWAKDRGIEPDRLLILPVAVQAKGLNGVSEHWEELVELVEEIQPSMVVLDTQARLTVGMEENSNTEMGVWVQAVDMVKRASKACVLVVHHTGRNGGDARGASALDGAQDAEWKVERREHKLECTLRMEKNKDGDDSARWTYAMEVVEVGKDEDREPITSLVLGGQQEPAERSMEATMRGVVADGESLSTRGWVERTLEVQEVDGAGLTIPKLIQLTNKLRELSGEEAIKEHTIRSAIKRAVEHGHLFRRGEKITAVDPTSDDPEDPFN